MPQSGQQEDLGVSRNEAEGWKKIPKALEETTQQQVSSQFPNQRPFTGSRCEQNKPPCVFPSRQQSYNPLNVDAMK